MPFTLNLCVIVMSAVFRRTQNSDAPQSFIANEYLQFRNKSYVTNAVSVVLHPTVVGKFLCQPPYLLVQVHVQILQLHRQRLIYVVSKIFRDFRVPSVKPGVSKL